MLRKLKTAIRLFRNLDRLPEIERKLELVTQPFAELTASDTPAGLALRFAHDLVELARMQGRSPTAGQWLEPSMPGLLGTLPDGADMPFLVDQARALALGNDLLDFGCGSAPHRDLLEAAGFSWNGVDYAGSDDPAALARTVTDNVTLYDGRSMPFGNSSFDVVWSVQSFEHVPDAEQSMRECARVLKAGGVFAGSVSFLEPFHARSTFCYTPFGWSGLCERHGLSTIKIYPRNDGISLSLRTLFMQLGFEATWEPLMSQGGVFRQALVSAAVEADRLNDALGALAGHFYFLCRKN